MSNCKYQGDYKYKYYNELAKGYISLCTLVVFLYPSESLTYVPF